MASDLTKFTVNLTARAIDALEAAVKVTGGTRTDAANRALIFYQILVQAKAGGTRFLELTPDEAGEVRNMLRFGPLEIPIGQRYRLGELDWDQRP